MQNRENPHVNLFLSLFTVAGIVFFDRVTKIFFSKVLGLGESLPLVRGIFHMTLVHNTGIAFGLFKNQGVVFIIIPVIMIILLVYNFYHYKYNNEKLSRLY